MRVRLDGSLPTPSSAAAERGGDDDEQVDELDLPPLDADDGDEQDDDAASELPTGVEERGDLDDSAAADLDVGDEIDEIEDDDGGEGEDAVDVGPLDEGIDVADEDRELGEDEAAAADADGIDIDETRDGDDGGVEGTSENPEDEVDEASLPDIDDGEDPGGDEDLAQALLAEGAEGSAEGVAAVPIPARERVVLLDGAGADVPCRSLAVAGGRVAAAGEILLLVEEGARAARRLPFGDGVIAVALADDGIVAATSRGQILGSQTLGAEVATLGALRAGASASSVQLAATPGRFWIRSGGTLSCATLGATATLRRDGGVFSIAASSGTLVAVTLSPAGAPAGPVVERFRGDDEGGRDAELTGPARALVERARDTLLLAAGAGGRCLALGAGREVAVSRDAGATFTLVHIGDVAALAFAGEGEDAPLLALATPPGGARGSVAFLVEIAPSGAATRIGEVPGVEREQPAAIAWDPSRELIWVASGAGLVALGKPPRH